MASAHPELFLIRSAETVWTSESRIQGQLDSRLTGQGQEQARRQLKILTKAGVSSKGFSFLSSPLGRARATAEIALFGLGGVVREDQRLTEIGLGRFQGLTLAQIRQRFPGTFDEVDPFQWFSTVPGGEGFDALQLRVRSFLADLKSPAVIFTHGIVSRFLRGNILGLDRAGMANLPAAQGVVYHLKNGKHKELT